MAPSTMESGWWVESQVELSYFREQFHHPNGESDADWLRASGWALAISVGLSC